ncbi:MAG: S4 domain-containing protein [Candidatus Woesearchaeota archaeon]
MVKNHLKRISAPRTWPHRRKSSVFIVRPDAGKQLELSLPSSLVFKSMLGVCETTKQVKQLMISGAVTIDGKKRKEKAYPVGLYDVITFTNSDASYRMTLGVDGKMHIIEIPSKEKDVRALRIERKVFVRGGKVQLGFLNGRTMLCDEKAYKVGDTLLVDQKGKISKHLSFEKGKCVQFIGGRHIGEVGTIEQVDGQNLTVNVAGRKIETLKSYAFVVGEKQPEITVSTK